MPAPNKLRARKLFHLSILKPLAYSLFIFELPWEVDFWLPWEFDFCSIHLLAGWLKLHSSIQFNRWDHYPLSYSNIYIWGLFLLKAHPYWTPSWLLMWHFLLPSSSWIADTCKLFPYWQSWWSGSRDESNQSFQASTEHAGVTPQST